MHEALYMHADDVVGMQIPIVTANLFPVIAGGLTNIPPAGPDYVPGTSGAPLNSVVVSGVQGKGARGFELVGVDINKTGASDVYTLQVFDEVAGSWVNVCLILAAAGGYRHIGATFRGNPRAVAFRVVGASVSGTAYATLHYRIIE